MEMSALLLNVHVEIKIVFDVHQTIWKPDVRMLGYWSNRGSRVMVLIIELL